MDLHQEFKKLAFDINKMKNRLMMLLLEIYEKEIYKKHGCSTIFEYGFKYAKLSRETVQLALRTLKNVENKPLLREKIETQGIYKVSIVAKLATPETDKLYAEHVENMPKPVLFEFAKEMRNGNEKCQAITTKMTIELDEETQILFNQLKKQYAENLSNREALKVILQNAMEQKRLERSGEKRADVPGNVAYANMKTGVGVKKGEAAAAVEVAEVAEVAEVVEVATGAGGAEVSEGKTRMEGIFGAENYKDVPGNVTLRANESHSGFGKMNNPSISNTAKKLQKIRKSSDAVTSSRCMFDCEDVFVQPEIKINSRTVLTKQKQEVHQKTNGKCAYPGCTRPIENLHHTIPFSFDRSHESVIGLCKIHHEFIHNGIIRNMSKNPNEWEIALRPEKSFFDSLYLAYRTNKLG